ncbi:MAG TPA: glycosyltransferase family 1 protein [Sphingobacterium sp.]|jgi:glycosyltransferase involved in cell wall biosynthesis|nr:glycosyltransferase family 1 protein [Sphingobacterium sp.]
MFRKKILFDAERMKYPNTGLYHFCLHLGRELSILFEREDGMDLGFYVPSVVDEFKANARRHVHPLHKIGHYFKTKPALWHATYQLSDYIPHYPAIKKVLTVHDLNFLREKEQQKQGAYLKRLQKNVDQSEAIVCISNFVRNELQQFCDLKDKMVNVIYNGNNINDALLPAKPERPGINFERPFIFSIGAVNRKKNFHTLPYLIAKNDLNLIISGDLVDKQYYHEILGVAKQLGVLDRVFFTGAIEEAEKYYLLKYCYLFCFPSISEGFGLPVVEAMSFGTNILLSTATSLPEIGGDVVHYMESFDPLYLVELGGIIGQGALCAHSADAVKKRAQLFQWSHTAKEYMNAYRHIL